jgi:ribonucleoside-diphosphate reductase alpha chain
MGGGIMALTEVTPVDTDDTNTRSHLADTQAPKQGAPVDPTATGMRIKKRNGSYEACDVNKIVRAIARCAVGLENVEALRVAMRTIAGLHDGATTEELDRLSIQTAAALVVDEPEYSKLAARLLGTFIDKEVRNQGIQSFSQAIAHEHQHGLVNDELFDFVNANARKLDDAIEPSRTWLFEYFGLRTTADRYLLRHPESRKVVETPQYFFLRVACGLSENVREAIDFYNLISSLAYLPSSPTLFNAGTLHTQMSSCYLLDSPLDSLDSIYDKYKDVARLSKHAGGIGLAYTRVRARGSLIKGTNGLSNGVVPWLKTLDSSVMAVNQGGRRKGAACVYLETWHGDIEEFLELRDNTGDDARRTHNLNLANWIPDLFMKRVEADAKWSLFDPKDTPELVDLFGDEFEAAYEKAEAEGKYMKQVDARELYGRMMRTLAQTGNGWMTFKDASNKKSNQTGQPGNVIHLSNLCTEILEVTSNDETAVCNLGSINLSKFVDDGPEGKHVAYDRIREVASTAVTYLDRVIDRNWYPTETSQASNARWRPVGLGMMGLQDVFFQLAIPFDSEEARKISARISEEIYYAAILRSIELAEEFGPHASFPETRAAQGKFQFDLWDNAQPQDPERFEELRPRMMKSGLRNSLIIAIAPTATIASIAGCYECIEPQVSNLFKRETLSGEFLQVNMYLVRDLQARGLWTEAMRDAIKLSEGSIQDIDEIPQDLRDIYRTAWEIPMRSLIDMAADRGAFIDQSQSLNLFMETPTIGKLSSMYMYAWQKGCKTTYYLRSRPATRIRQTTTTDDVSKKTTPDETVDLSLAEKIACSLENPESCEACQ